MGKSCHKTQNEAARKVQTVFATIEEAEKQEDSEHSGQDLLELGDAATITSEKLEKAVKQLELTLEEKPKDKPLKKAISTLRRDLLPRLRKYETHQRNLGERNSYSKTDKDATLRIPADPDTHTGSIRTANRKHPDTLSSDLILR